MSNIFIHAGNHKTGTSSIQSYLFKNKKEISAAGLDVYMRGRPNYKPNDSHGNLHWWFDEKKVDQGGARFKEGFLDDLLSFPSGKDVIASSECFSWIFDKEVLYQLRDNLKSVYSGIKVVFYIRRQDLHAVSHYQQASKTFADRKFFTGDYRSLPFFDDNLPLYFDYNYRIGMWGDVFGDNNIIIRVYDREEFPNGSVIKDFFNCLEIEAPSDEEPTTNSSQGWERTKVRHLMWEAGIEPRTNIAKNIFWMLDNNGKMLPSKDEAKRFYDHFKVSNYFLNKRFCISKNSFVFNEDFDMYPLTAQDTWSEESANKAIVNLLKGVGEHLKKTEK